MQKVIPFLWFDNRAEEAAKFYVSIFKNSKLLSPTTFQLDGQEFIAFNGGPHFTFTPAISLFVNCETQQEVDEFWEKLSEGGEEVRCGWLKTNSASPGKLSPQFWSSCCTTKIPRNQRGSAMPCFK